MYTYKIMGGSVSRTQFDWSYTEEPHASRRRIILRKHPEIKRLFGYDHSFKYVVVAMVFTQILIAYLLRDADWFLILLQTYCAGAVFNGGLIFAIHEMVHNIAFGVHQPWKNRYFGIFANLPLIVPLSISYKKYHIEHHRYLGEEVLDTDVPTELECRLFTNTCRKLIYLVVQPIFVIFRPAFVYRKGATDMEVLNAIIQFTFNFLVYEYFGGKSLVYLFASTLIGMGCHPSAGHIIAAHTVFTQGQDTYTYLGPVNYVTFNIGYHVEHHDFPFIPSRRLPLVRKIAPEFYEDLQTHTSYIRVLWQFVTDPQMGTYAHLKRPQRTEPLFYGRDRLSPKYWDTFLSYVGYFKVQDYLIKMRHANVS